MRNKTRYIKQGAQVWDDLGWRAFQMELLPLLVAMVYTTKAVFQKSMQSSETQGDAVSSQNPCQTQLLHHGACMSS